MPSQRTLIFGYGYLGRRVADLAVAAGDQVWATTRRPEKFDQLSVGPIRPLLVDWTDRVSLTRLPEVDRVVVAVSYDSTSPHGRYDSQVGGLKNLVERISPAAKVCYISTTGVYHQDGGVWVDERSPTRPQREGAKVHLQAEELLQRLRPSGATSKSTILRLAGIYGPARLPRVADVIAGRPILANPDAYLNLIHVDDAARAVMTAWLSSTHSLYVVADDRPVLRSEFYEFAASRYNAPGPKFALPTESGSDRMRSTGNKRIWNRRMKKDLLPKLAFPSYLDGIDALVKRREFE